MGPSSATASNLNALVMLSTSDGWAVGEGGTVLHFDGTSWNLIPSGTTLDLIGISFGPPAAPTSSGFAVGGSAGNAVAIYRSDVTWSAATAGLSAPAAQKLSAVFEVGPNDAWAVDSVSGAFWHWSGSVGLGGGWTLVSNAAAGLNSVFMVSPIEGWAVGDGGIIYHYTGGAWTLYSAVGTTLNSLFMSSPTDGWAVGNGGVIYHYSSGSWTGAASPSSSNQDLRSVFMINQNEGWAVGASGTTLHYMNGVWTAIPLNLLATTQNLNAVYFSGGMGWAVGDLGTIVALNGQTTQGGEPSANFQSVYLSNSNDGWIVGCSTGGCGSASGEPTVAHWNGGSLTRGTTSSSIADLYSVFMVNPSEGWAVGGVGSNPLIVHYTGGTWTQVPAPGSGFILHSVSMVDSNTGWAVGSMGVILAYSGGSWGILSSPTSNTLRSVFMLGASDGWAVGDGGVMLQYQAGQWAMIPSHTGAQLNSISLSNSMNGWAVGAGGTILHYDGNIWVSVADFASANLNSVFSVNQQDAWAVGDSGTILHWDGSTWNTVTPSSIAGNPNLQAIFLTSTGSGLIVGAPSVGGAQGTILLVPQTNPIPEIPDLQILIGVTLTAVLSLISKLHKRNPILNSKI